MNEPDRDFWVGFIAGTTTAWVAVFVALVWWLA